MKTIINKTEDHTMYLTVELDTIDMEKSRGKTYNRLIQTIDGQKLNKTSLNITTLEDYIGKEKFSEETLKDIIPEIYSRVISEQGFEIVLQPKVDIIQVDPPILEMIIPMKPVIKLCDYNNIKIKSDPTDIDNKDINFVLEGYEIISLTARALIDLFKMEIWLLLIWRASYSGVSLINKKAKMIKVTHEFFNDIPGLYNKIIGMKKDVEYEFVLFLPDDYSLKSTAGKNVEYKVNIYDVQELVLPDIDDEFANRVAPGVGTLDNLIERIEKNLRKEREDNAKSTFKYRLMDTIIKESQLKYPEVMIEIETDQLMNQHKQELQTSARDNTEYEEKMKNINTAAYREEIRQLAEKRFLWTMVIDEVAKLENITVDDKEIDEEIKARISENGIKKSQYSEYLDDNQNRKNAHDLLKARKTISRLTEIIID